MLPASPAAIRAKQAASFPLAQHAEASSTPINETLRKVDNAPGSLASIAIKCMGLKQFRQLSTVRCMAQGPLQELKELLIQEQNELLIQELNCSINGLWEKPQAALKQGSMDYADQEHYFARGHLKLYGSPPSWPRLPRDTRYLPRPEAYRPVLDGFEKLEQQFAGDVYAGPEGQSLQSTKALLCAMHAHAQVIHGSDSHTLTPAHSEVTARAMLTALKDETLPAKLRQIAASLFIDCVRYQPLIVSRQESKILRSIVKSMAPEEAATYLGNMTKGIHTILLGNTRGMDAADKQMFNTLLDIADRHPNDRGRASILVQLLIPIRLLQGWPDRVELEHKILEVFAHLPDKGEGCLSLAQAIYCLQALPSATDPLMRDEVQAAAIRIVKSAVPLPADEADGLRNWLRSHLKQLTNVEQHIRLVPSQ